MLASAVAVAQLFVVVTPGNQSYHTTAVFLVAAALLLPPELVALMALVQHVPDWLKRRLPFHIQTFNIANYTLAAMAAWAVAHAILDAQPFGRAAHGALVAGAAACVVFVGAQPRLLAPMLRLRTRALVPRVRPLHAGRTSRPTSCSRCSASGSPTLWALDPVADAVRARTAAPDPPLALGPGAAGRGAERPEDRALQRALLRDDAARGARRGPPASSGRCRVIMADLDLLRDINNTYGHLAGDAVLAGVAQVFREQLRDYDVPARFGGEEFSILLPETAPQEALEIAERIRRAVAACEFEVETSSEPIHATVSLGVASFPRDGADANELVHQADLAVYRAKLQGRNRVLDASNEPMLAQPEPRADAASPCRPERRRRARVTRCRPRPRRRRRARAAHRVTRPHTPRRPALLLGAAPLALPRRRSSASPASRAGVAGAITGDSRTSSA